MSDKTRNSAGVVVLKVGVILGAILFSVTLMFGGPVAFLDTLKFMREYDRIYAPASKQSAEQIALRADARARADEIINGNSGWSAIASSIDGEIIAFTGTFSECHDFTTSVRDQLLKTNVYIGCSKN